MENKKEFHSQEQGFLPFDPIVLLRDLAKRWLAILLAALIAGVGAYIYTDRNYQPVYRTSTTFVVTHRGSSTTVYNNLSSTSTLASVFTELLNSSLLRSAVLEEIGQTSFNGTVSASVISETNLISMTVTASNPRDAFVLAQAIIDHHELVTYQVVENVSLEVLQSPTVPTYPSNYNNASFQMKQMMLRAGCIAAVIVLLLSYIQDTVRSSAEAKAKLDCAFLGEIPHENKYKTLASRIRPRKAGILISSPVTSFRYAETIRKLRHRVEQRMGSGKVLMVTSLLENEGKSTVAANLALSMAQKNKRVLLIDSDLYKPACHILMDQSSIPWGLRSILHGRAEPSQALLRYKDTSLYLVLEKKADSASGDLASGSNMRGLIQWARENFDFVVLDLPPMAEVSDAESLMELADASILVVRQNAAAASAINKAIATLNRGRAKLLGCVLNNVYSTALSSGQGYGYGYGYGYGKYGKYGHYGHYGAYGSKKNRE